MHQLSFIYSNNPTLVIYCFSSVIYCNIMYIYYTEGILNNMKFIKKHKILSTFLLLLLLGTIYFIIDINRTVATGSIIESEIEQVTTEKIEYLETESQPKLKYLFSTLTDDMIEELKNNPDDYKIITLISDH